jgi:phenylacetate-CoA ligase
MGRSANKEVKVKQMSLEEIEKFQAKKLRGFLRLVYKFHPYYRNVMKENRLRPEDFKSVKDIQKLPFTKKEDWVGLEKDFILRPNKKIIKYLGLKTLLEGIINREKVKEKLKYEFFPATFFATSGRTGNSVACFYTRYDFDLIANHTVEALEPILKDLNYNVRLQITFPYAPHLAFWHSVFGWLKEPSVFSIILGAGRSMTQLDLMQKFKTNALLGMPSYVYHLSELVAENKVQTNVKYIITAGEYLPENMKKRIKENFSKFGEEPKILQAYASTESKAAIFERKENDGYIINPSLHLWEVVDPKTGEQVSFEEGGMLVFTHLDFRGTVFLRYWTDDIISKGLFYEDGSLKLKGDITRVRDSTVLTTKVKGTLVNFLALENVLSSLKEIKEYQAVIKKKDKHYYSLDELLVKISIKKRYEKIKEEVIRKVKEIIKDRFEITPKVKIVPFENLVNEIFEKLKGSRVVDLRNKL